MDIRKAKLIHSIKNNQFYTVMRIDEDVGTIYLQLTKNRHKDITKSQIAHIEDNPEWKCVIMHDNKTTAEQHFLDVMNANGNVYAKINELKCFRKNMLMDSENAMRKLEELLDYRQDEKICDMALQVYTKINHRKIIDINRNTYINQEMPTDIKQLALSKRLFIERSDDYCNKGENKHPCDRRERLQLQSLYPCGFLVRDQKGIVIAGKKYSMQKEEAIDFVKKYIPSTSEKKGEKLYKVPIPLEQKKQLAKCNQILESYFFVLFRTLYRRDVL